MRRLLVLLLPLIPVAFAAQTGVAAQPKPPTTLAATAASRSAVTLSWTAGDLAATKYQVERKPLGAAWTPPPPPAKPVVVTMPATTTTLEDKTVDTYTTYVYRVRALGTNDVASTPSNEITVGPPPVGFTQVLVEPAGLHEPGNQFAPLIAMTLDANDDPAIAYVFMDPNNDTDNKDSMLWFVTWNRATYRWNAPVSVATVGDVDPGRFRNVLSVAFDATTRQFGIAHMVGGDIIRLTLSADGLTWRTVTVEENSDRTIGYPSLAMGQGRISLAYYHAGDGLRFKSGLATDPPSKWKSQVAPKLPDTWMALGAGPSLVLDANGAPAVAYWVSPESGYNYPVAFWRPNQNSQVKVTDTAGYQNDGPDLRLAFGGGQAAIVMAAMRDADDFHQIWLARSPDGGATWSAPVALPLDGGQNEGGPVSMALDAQARVSVLTQVNGGNTSGTRCGLPKLTRQADATRWTTCAPETKGTPTGNVTTPMLALAGNNKLYLAFRTGDSGGGLKPGILLWRER